MLRLDKDKLPEVSVMQVPGERRDSGCVTHLHPVVMIIPDALDGEVGALVDVIDDRCVVDEFRT